MTKLERLFLVCSLSSFTTRGHVGSSDGHFNTKMSHQAGALRMFRPFTASHNIVVPYFSKAFELPVLIFFITMYK